MPNTTTNDSQPQLTASMASARNARRPSCAATASLRFANRYMTGIASAVTIKPGQENAWPSRCHRPQPAAATTYAASANSKPPAIRLAVCSDASEKAPVPELDRKAPDQDAGRGELDEAVDAERQQTDAMRRDLGGNGNHGLDHHPDDREPFEAKRLRDQRRTLGVGKAGYVRRRFTTVLCHCTAPNGKPLNYLNCRI
jgi:hypothetical protein